MDNLTTIQSLYLKWHKHHGICSIDQIRVACYNLLKTFDLETQSSLFKIFFPIVRKGLIEFCGDGKFQLSSPCIFFYPKERIAVGVNLYSEQKDKLEDNETLRKDEFGIVRFETERERIRAFCDKNELNYSEPNSEEILSNYPKISDVVNCFERVSYYTLDEFYDVKNYRWVRNKNRNNGIGRVAEDAHKFYLRRDGMTLLIPDMRINPDGRPLAESYQAVQDNISFLYYSREARSLKVDRINIPILIDRVLRLASLYNTDGVLENFSETVYSNISLSAIKQLNRIFETKINIKS